MFDEQGIAKGFRKRILNAAMQHLGVGGSIQAPANPPREARVLTPQLARSNSNTAFAEAQPAAKAV